VERSHVRADRCAPQKGRLEDLLAVAGVGRVEVHAGSDDLVDTGWLTTKAMANSIIDRPASSATC